MRTLLSCHFYLFLTTCQAPELLKPQSARNHNNLCCGMKLMMQNIKPFSYSPLSIPQWNSSHFSLRKEWTVQFGIVVLAKINSWKRRYASNEKLDPIVDKRNKKTPQNQCSSSTEFSKGATSHWKHAGSPDTLQSATSGVDIPKSLWFIWARESGSWRGQRGVDITGDGSEGKDGAISVLTSLETPVAGNKSCTYKSKW